MNSLIATLRRIVGRIDMFQAIFSLSIVLIPLGYYFAFEVKTPEAITGGLVTILTGMIIMLISLNHIVKEEKKRDKESQWRFNSLITELKGLRDDLREKKDERRNNDNRDRNL